jgi:hypothetical protein
MDSEVGAITLRLEKVDDLERAVVVDAPRFSRITAELLAEIALGRGVDSDVSDNTLTLGVEGHGEGCVTYQVDAYDPHSGTFALIRRP